MGSGEVAGYTGKYGPAKVTKAIFIGALPPFLTKTLDSPTGIDVSVLQGIAEKLEQGRLTFLTAFLKVFYNVSLLNPSPVSGEVLRADFNVAAQGSAVGTLARVPTWSTDFRPHLSKPVEGDDAVADPPRRRRQGAAVRADGRAAVEACCRTPSWSRSPAAGTASPPPTPKT